MLEEQDDTILARWLEGKLTLAEQTTFEKSEEFKDYARIAQGMQRFKKPEYHKEVLRGKILFATAKTNSKSKVIIFRPWAYIAAATVLLFISLGLYFSTVDYVTQAGEQLTISLPDGSKVKLNASSHLQRKRFFWTHDRSVALLKGEGFFEVEKGKEVFLVKTDAGNIKVLGTKFNIKIRNGTFVATCYQGKIQFEKTGTKEKTVLTAGHEIRKSENKFIQGFFSETQPAWLNGKSVFKNAPLKQVIEELEIQYGITIKSNLVDTNRNFTGSFVHEDLQTALKTVFTPMEINYSVGSDGLNIILNP